MEPMNWAPEHSDALRRHLAENLSFSEAVKAINLKFDTGYTRNAAIGRARRMGLAGPDRPKPASDAIPVTESPSEPRAAGLVPSARHWQKQITPDSNPPKLRCAAIDPRRLSLTELEFGDCRYPYGGDEEGETITFCGHPRRPGSSYCAPHFRLSRNPVEPPEYAAITLWVRMFAPA
jgi:GcrA cell cycle regulator